MVGCGQGRKPYIGREVRDFHHLKKSGFGDVVMSPIGASSSGDPLAEAAIKLAPRSPNMSLEWSISSINVLKLVAQPHKRCRSNFLIAAADPLSLKRVSV